MTHIISHHNLTTALIEVGFPLPPEITALDIRTQADGVVELHIVCNLTSETLHKLGQAMQVLAVQQRLT